MKTNAAKEDSMTTSTTSRRTVMDDADLTRLRKVAETAAQVPWHRRGDARSGWGKFAAAANPPTVLALLDHIAALTAERDEWMARYEEMSAERDAAVAARDEAEDTTFDAITKCHQAIARAEAAEATVQRVRDLHYRCGADGPDRLLVGDGYCHECVLAWPCPTITALAAPAQTEEGDRD